MSAVRHVLRLATSGLVTAAIGLAAAALPAVPARAQATCESNLAELQRAEADSSDALKRVTGELDAFEQALSGPPQILPDPAGARRTRTDIDAYLTALNDFGVQAGEVAAQCGDSYTADLQRLSATIAAFQDQRARAGALLDTYESLAAEALPAPVPPPEQPPAAAAAPGRQTACTDSLAVIRRTDAEAETALRQADQALAGFRTAMRGPRDPQIDGNVAAQTADQLQTFLSDLNQLYQEGQENETLCGADYDAALQRINGRIVAAQRLIDQADQLDQQYAALLNSGEPRMTAPQMQEVQAALGTLGFYKGASDAVFGPNTRDAIRAYQSNRGYEATGFITLAQRDALLAEAAAAASAPAAAVAPAPPVQTLPRVPLAQIRTILEPAAPKDLPPQFSRTDNPAADFQDVMQLVRDFLQHGQPVAALSQQFRLFGAAYLQAGADSREMIDAHALAADINLQLGDINLAAQHLDRALAIIDEMTLDAPYEEAWLLVWRAEIALRQAVAGAGTRRFISTADYQTILGQIDRAAALVGQAADAADPLAERLRDLQADLQVAANVEPEDAAVWQRIGARYPQ